MRNFRSDCSNTMEQLRDMLYEKYDINTQFSLVGSGGDSRNMVTRNGDGPFDLDYNLVIISMPDQYQDNLKMLKDRVRDSLNKIVENTWFSDGKDSRSVITSILHFKDSPEIEFSFDIAILTRNSNGNLCRLIHNNKGCWNENFTWNEVPHSKNVKDKIAKETNFIKDNVEKVMRLADILEFVFTSKWKDKLALKGGTAINLFYRELPRLSVDIDLDYIGDTKEEMEKDKEELWNFLQMALFQKNYSLSPQSIVI